MVQVWPAAEEFSLMAASRFGRWYALSVRLGVRLACRENRSALPVEWLPLAESHLAANNVAPRGPAN